MKRIRLKAHRGRSTAYLGIWWWTGTQVIGQKVPRSAGYAEDTYIHPVDPNGSVNHSTIWKQVQRQARNQEEVSGKFYKDVERGRVVYNRRSCCFEIICSQEVASDPVAKKAILDYFNLNGLNVDFIPLAHYHAYQEGNNPALESFYDNF